MRRLLFTSTAILLAGCSACLAQVSTMGSTAMGLPSTPGTVVICSTPTGQIGPGTPTVTVTSVSTGALPSIPAAPTMSAAPDNTTAPILALSAQPATSFMSTIPGSTAPALTPAIPAPSPPSINAAPIATSMASSTATLTPSTMTLSTTMMPTTPLGTFRTPFVSSTTGTISPASPLGSTSATVCSSAPGGAADQWCRYATLDPRCSEHSSARHDPTRGHAACRHQHRSDNGRDADAKHAGMRRERDDESGDTRHDGAGQRDGSRRNTWRIARGLLTATTPPDALSGMRPLRPGIHQTCSRPVPRIHVAYRGAPKANTKTLFNGGTD